ncbi:transcription initiation factor TFIIB [Halorientalis persicus]|uniref:Transcription initiation factor TFIIB n=1 Tax=Halorientalis persicus TaxID=1367881 RepID=A0A1H8U9H4_9EURY|nr:transcription initiation factor IIB family protein [Halorientalis persicus]SEO99697.1 transcription initiation factor TFIIB [Halorientalis persicus]
MVSFRELEEDASVSESSQDNATATEHTEEGESHHLDTDSCPDCSGALRVVDGDVCCEECGRLIEGGSSLEYNPEYAEPDGEIQPKDARETTTKSRHDDGLTTVIGQSTNVVPSHKQARLTRLRKHHRKAQLDSEDTALASAHGEVNRLISALDLPSNYREQAGQLLRDCESRGFLPNYGIDTIAAVVVYATIRLNRLPRTLVEVASEAQVSLDQVRRAYRAVVEDTELPIPPRRPREFIPPLTSKLDVEHSVEHRAIEIADAAFDVGYSSGKDPEVMAATCLLLAAREDTAGTHIPVVELAEATSTTGRGILKRVEEIHESDVFEPAAQ